LNDGGKIMDYDKIAIIPSKRSSGAVVPIKNNVIIPDFVEWPPTELLCKLYKSEHIKDYDEKYHPDLVNELGYYCDLESIKSEDTVTWSLFGYISKMDKEIQNNFYNELLEKLNFDKDIIMSIELWKTLPHPQTFSPKGPEIDVFMLGEKYYILVECKWTSGIGKKIFPQKECIILLVGNKNIDSNIFMS
jgi:hypothetical protein